MHRLFLVHPIPAPGQTLLIEGDEAAHALRVKRLGPGDTLALLDGCGVTALARVDPPDFQPASRRSPASLRLTITDRTEHPPPSPALDVFTATPKGARPDDLIDQLSQVGAASWAPLHTERGVVDPRPAKLDRLERIARESAKQCGRPWLLRIDPPRDLRALLADPSRPATILADASGEPYRPMELAAPSAIRLLIGPEGGWSPAELQSARAASATIARFGPHTMRIETAAVAAAAIIMAAP
ncbi:MAG: RsmE family RNA methyltransferase [Phycisphaerales bacterium]